MSNCELGYGNAGRKSAEEFHAFEISNPISIDQLASKYWRFAL